jgi:hypothetical protein
MSCHQFVYGSKSATTIEAFGLASGFTESPSLKIILSA